jgi:NAD-dependent dihydropyrimidine dehydrogenase PreA subunit
MRMSPDAARIGYDNRAFLARAVAHVARKGGRQFIDIGSDLPLPTGNTHQWAQAADMTARVIYVDNDPAVIAHLKAQVEFIPQVIALHGDLRNPRDIMTSPTLNKYIDLSQPATVILGAVLHFIDSRARRCLAQVALLRLGTLTAGADPDERVICHRCSRCRVLCPTRAYYPTTYNQVVLAHARALLTSNAEGAIQYIDGDLRNTGPVLTRAAQLLDFTRPVAVTLLSILHAVPDDGDPCVIVATLMDAVPPGSSFAVSPRGI